MISFVNVFVKYTKEFYALSSVNLKADKGEVVALVGPKDSGKTCLLRLLAGLEKPDKGEIYIKDIPVEKIDYQTDVSMGYIPYKANFFDKKSVYDNLKYVLDIRKTDKKRASYHNYYSELKWGAATSYDLCINSKIGIENAAQLIIDIYNMK